MGRGEVPKRRRDIRTKENREPVILENPRRDHSRKSREDTCQNPGESRNSENRSSRARRNIVTRKHDQRIHDKIRTIHLVDTWQRSAPSGKVPTRSKSTGDGGSTGKSRQKTHPSEIGIREIGNHRDKESMRCGTSNPEIPMSGLITVTR